MRLGAVLAVAGVVALGLGGVTAWFVLGGDGDGGSSVAVASPSPSDGAASEAGAEQGSVQVRGLDGARVEIDGEDRGEVPISLVLAVGQHRVEVTAPGYHPWQTTIDVQPGANAAVKAELVEAEAEPEVIEVAVEAADEGADASSPTGKAKSKRSKAKRPKAKADEVEAEAEPKVEPKPKPKSDVFMNSSKGGDDGIFMPVGGK